ncbi:putative serine/threonine-protein kinase-like protein CCR3, partial [Triticum dicoccoides]|uniref:putative serine/threonine-protein kinase-like protein CCR3 n=1 Tax=Triticum dicoccoides TaxID=85692 RepID=UPI00188E7E2E
PPLAAMAQLIGQASGLIYKIIREVETARQNRRECELLARRVPTINGVLSRLPKDPEVAPPLQELKSTLEEAHDMVVACRSWGAARQFFGSRRLPRIYSNSRHAECFSQVNARINSDVGILNLSLSSYMARRHPNQVLHPDHIGVTTATIATAPWPWPGSSSGSLQTQMVVSQQSQVSLISSDNPRVLTWSEIAAATSFAVELGRGSSGRVYKGRLQFHFHHDMEVAIKVLEKHARKGVEDAFVAEFYILSGLRHDNIVRLVGWCTEQEYRMLVYEHMGNGTLSDHLHRVGGGPSLSPVTASWRTRIEVLLGVARAIEYLHHEADPLVIHRNVSSSNILLDASWMPRLSGFGSAVFQEAGREHGGQPVGEVMGTFGYIDSEYSYTTHISPASDVYSFGVVMLEALTGRPPVIYGVTLLVDSALPSLQNGKLRDVLDRHPALQPTLRQLEALDLVAQTAIRCLCPRGHNRLAMSEVVANLQRALAIIRNNEPMPWGRASLI